MKCAVCGQNLFVDSNEMKSEEGSTDVYSVMTMKCRNQKCSESKGEGHIIKKKVN